MSLSAAGTTATAKPTTTAVKRVLLVDDDETLRHTLAEQLQLEGDFSTVEAGTGEAGLAMAKQEKLDAILLDVGLPDADGRQLCAQMRDAGIVVPIIMLTAVDGDADTIEGLESGANDYVTKPFRLGVLLARLRAVQLQPAARAWQASLHAIHIVHSWRPAPKNATQQHLQLRNRRWQASQGHGCERRERREDGGSLPRPTAAGPPHVQSHSLAPDAFQPR